MHHLKALIQLKKGIANLPKTSVVVVSQVATVDKLRLLEKIGTLNREKKRLKRSLKVAGRLSV